MLLRNIGVLVGVDGGDTPFLRGKDMDRINTIENAWLRIRDGRFLSFGKMDECPVAEPDEELADAGGGYVFPSFCDSHTHIVYAGSREREFIDKINGLSYEEIARRGGGILNSADLLHETSEDELYNQAMTRVREIMAMGTGCVEIKSGYGLTTADELKMLRVIARIAESTPMKVKATFLGAHAVGRAFAGRQDEYVSLVCDEMIPAVAAEGLAEFVDVFCDAGFFTVEDTDRILTAASRYGLRPKIHANELAISGGVQIGVKHGALSVDHLERIGEEEIALLSQNQTVATMLPGASFFLEMPYGPARKAIESGAILALASDYNPGSSPSGNMRMVMSLGCIKMKLSPSQAINATTINGAYAMGESRDYGSIAPGKIANFYITRPMPSIDFYPYAYATPVITHTYIKGKEVKF
ncbi:imidazolonepropionase [uncultured Duncaniella sp.]|uniref:imidazolonepropionase n=1 Tax=uncultured Duncaniella sp. TaxID=2768039 RepID=UPI0027120F37|nr:imidazolonepropionase [uncultured Duncaniella sp.]